MYGKGDFMRALKLIISFITMILAILNLMQLIPSEIGMPMMLIGISIVNAITAKEAFMKKEKIAGWAGALMSAFGISVVLVIFLLK